MVTESFFKQDIEIENKLGKWLDTYFYSNTALFQKVERNYDYEKQRQGCDITIQSMKIFGDQTQHIVDEKAAIKYVKKSHKDRSLETFAFELDYCKDGFLKPGWLFGDDYCSTEYYLVLWIWADVDAVGREKYDWRQISEDTITKVEGVFLSKKSMREYASRLGVTPSVFRKLREDVSRNNNKKLSDGGRIFLSSQLSEQPMNLLIKKEQLIRMATYHFEQKVYYSCRVILDYLLYGAGDEHQGYAATILSPMISMDVRERGTVALNLTRQEASRYELGKEYTMLLTPVVSKYRATYELNHSKPY